MAAQEGSLQATKAMQTNASLITGIGGEDTLAMTQQPAEKPRVYPRTGVAFPSSPVRGKPASKAPKPRSHGISGTKGGQEDPARVSAAEAQKPQTVLEKVPEAVDGGAFNKSREFDEFAARQDFSWSQEPAGGAKEAATGLQGTQNKTPERRVCS